MIAITTSLARFCTPIVTGRLTTDLRTVVNIPSVSGGGILTVDSDFRPLGWLKAETLLHYLADRLEKGDRSEDILSETLGSIYPLDPITTLDENTDIAGAIRGLTEASLNTTIILTDRRGLPTGKIDLEKLIKYLINPEIREYRQDSDRESDFNLEELLDRLPFPVSLYDSDDNPVYRNRCWTVEIGEGWAGNKERTFPVELKSARVGQETLWKLEKISLDNRAEQEIILATDIGQQRNGYLELSCKNAELTQLNRLKNEFLSCISHELKSPLTAVVGLSNLLKERKIGELNPRQSKYADMIYHSGQKLMTLVNDLLDLTRLETGQMQLSPSKIHLKNLCQRVKEVIEEKYAARELNLPVEIETGLEYITADPSRLHQMLVHLLDNAVKFSPDRLDIRLKINGWENWITFTVSDTGIGIPERLQPLIFQKFQQLESPLNRQFEGTGLGLVLTQKLARFHGGELSFISTEGKGSKFTLLLPRHPVAEKGKRGLKSDLVLIGEAAPHRIEQLTNCLEELGVKVVVARAGTEAIEKARQIRPRCIFLSPHLPLLSGWDVLTLLKSDPLARSPRIILIADPEDRERALQQGADGCLVPPLTPAALQACLNLSPAGESPLPRHRPVILRLHGDHPAPNGETTPSKWFWNDRSGDSDYRFLETDNLEQGALLATVWQVDALAIDGSIAPDPLTYLQRLNDYPELRSLPLITLDAEVTEAANRIPGLLVYPCLATPTKNRLEGLLEVIAKSPGIDPERLG